MTRLQHSSFARAAALAALLLASTAGAQETGTWRLDSRQDDGPGAPRVQLALSRGADMMVSSAPLPLSRLRGLTAAMLDGPQREVRFTLPAEAGTVAFTGTVGRGSGSGQFAFTPNRAFGATLQQHGIPGGVEDYDYFRLAVHDVGIAQVDPLVAALRRYDDTLPTAGELIRLVNHDVDAAVVADFGDAGLRRLDPEQIIRLTNHGVDGRYVRALRAEGYAASDVERIVYIRKHGDGFKGDAKIKRK